MCTVLISSIKFICIVFECRFLRKILYSGYICFVLQCCLFVVVFSICFLACLSLVYLALDYETQVLYCCRSVVAHNYFFLSLLISFYFLFMFASFSFISSDCWVFFPSYSVVFVFISHFIWHILFQFMCATLHSHTRWENVSEHLNESQNSNSNRTQALPVHGLFFSFNHIMRIS